MNTLETAALDYLHVRGWTAHPLTKNAQGFAKVPITTAWEHLHSQADEDVSTLAWGNAAGLGLVLGKASGNLAVIDVDDEELAGALVAWLVTRPGKPLYERTARNRLHVFVIEPEPSPHRNLTVVFNGRACPIQILGTTSEGGGDNVAVAPTPGYHMDYPNDEPAYDTAANVLRAIMQGTGCVWPDEAAAASAGASVSSANYPRPWQDLVPLGERNDAQFLEACQCAEGGMDFRTCVNFMRWRYATAYEHDPRDDQAHGDKAMITTIASAYRRVAQKLRERPVEPAGADTAAEATEPVPTALDASFIDWATFWEKESHIEEWLCEPLLPAHRAIATYSPAKSGKSLLALDVAARLATGARIFDQPALAPVEVLYLDFEMTEDDVRERLEEMGYGPSTDFSHFHYSLLPSIPALDTPEGGEAVVTLALHFKAALIVIDTTSRVLSGKENDADTMRAFYQWTGLPLKAQGCTVWRLDHSGKDMERGQRGTSAKNDDVDLVWELTRGDGAAIRLRATHRRQSWVPEVLDLIRLENPFLHERAAEAWPAGTHELASKLDSLGIDINTTVAAARRQLKAENISAGRNDTLAAAVRYRKQNPNGRGIKPLTNAEEQARVTPSNVGVSNLLGNATSANTGNAPVTSGNEVHGVVPLLPHVSGVTARPGVTAEETCRWGGCWEPAVWHSKGGNIPWCADHGPEGERRSLGLIS